MVGLAVAALARSRRAAPSRPEVATRIPLPALAVSRTVDLNGPVHFVDFGGPPGTPVLVCVHGVGGSHVTWLAVGPRLARSYRVLALDLPGHGLTPPAGRPATLEASRRLLHQFLREVVGEPVILVGSSMGAVIALLQASSSPSTIAGAVLIDPALPLADLAWPNWMLSQAFLQYAVAALGERYAPRSWNGATREEVVRRLLAFSCADPDRVPPEIVEAYVALGQWRKSQRGLDQAFLEATLSLFWLLNRPARVRALMSTVTAPILLLHGDADRLVSLGAARAAAAANPSWCLEVAIDTGHTPMLERPDWTAGVIRDWLTRAVDVVASASA